VLVGHQEELKEESHLLLEPLQVGQTHQPQFMDGRALEESQQMEQLAQVVLALVADRDQSVLLVQ
jgi:hypothetical protein